jgi:hypothetical protein
LRLMAKPSCWSPAIAISWTSKPFAVCQL